MVLGIICFWFRRCLRVVGGYEEVLFVDGRVGVVVWVVVDTYMVLV